MFRDVENGKSILTLDRESRQGQVQVLSTICRPSAITSRPYRQAQGNCHSHQENSTGKTTSSLYAY